MRCLGSLFLFPILLLVLIVYGVFSAFSKKSVHWRFTERQDDDFDINSVREKQGNTRYDKAQTVDFEEIPDSNPAPEPTDDYDPKPGKYSRIEDTNWEEIK